MEIIVLDPERYTEEIRVMLETLVTLRSTSKKVKYRIGVYSEHLYAEEKMPSPKKKAVKPAKAEKKEEKEETEEERNQKLAARFRRIAAKAPDTTAGTDVIRFRSGIRLVKYRKGQTGYYMAAGNEDKALSQAEITAILELLETERKENDKVIAVALP